MIKPTTWESIRGTVSFSAEGHNHPHTSSEQAYLFSSRSLEETELEYLDFLYGLVSITKPTLALETGTYFGLSASAIGAAFADSRHDGYKPSLDTVEKDRQRAELARSFMQTRGLADFVTVHMCSSLEFLRKPSHTAVYEFVYFDSSRITRLDEFRILYSADRLAPGATLLFHDTSPCRADSQLHDREVQERYLKGLDGIGQICDQRVDFPLSRGLTIFRL